MQVKNGISKGLFTSQRKLNTVSKRIDRRTNPKYRSGNSRQGKVIEEDGKRFIVWDDGEKEELHL